MTLNDAVQETAQSEPLAPLMKVTVWRRIISAEIEERTVFVFNVLSKFVLIACFPGAGLLTYCFVCGEFQTAHGFV